MSGLHAARPAFDGLIRRRPDHVFTLRHRADGTATMSNVEVHCIGVTGMPTGKPATYIMKPPASERIVTSG
jgi:hypothetical protein